MATGLCVQNNNTGAMQCSYSGKNGFTVRLARKMYLLLLGNSVLIDNTAALF